MARDARRQSSISYFTPRDSTSEPRTSLWPSPTGVKHGLTRSVSVDSKTPLSSPRGGGASGVSPGDRQSTGPVEYPQPERSPHTLAEKYVVLCSRLARFIFILSDMPIYYNLLHKKSPSAWNYDRN